jgi:Tol biopolymer transport system component
MNELVFRDGILLITSSSYGELMREEKDLKGGTFMHFFIEAIKKCDSSTGSKISLLDVFENTKKKVIDYTKSRKYKQTPVIKGKISKKIIFTSSLPEEKFSGNLLFSSDCKGNQDIYIMNVNGKINLTEKSGVNSCPVWSPDGKKIAFISNRTGNFDVFIMDCNGTNQINMSDSTENNYRPSWSPDGSRLAYISRVNGLESIFIINADGTGKSQITKGKDWKDSKPLWSPDGSKIAFISNRRGNNDIYTINPDTMELVNLTGNHLSISDFLWSPDGKHIAFTARSNEKSDLYIMNNNGTMATNITNDNGTEYDFSWSPDGRKIAFTTTEYTENTANLCVIDIESRQKTSLTSDGIWKRQLSWSHDSTKILFCAGTKAPCDIYEIKSDGTGLLKLVGGEGNNQEPSWGPINEEK